MQAAPKALLEPEMTEDSAASGNCEPSVDRLRAKDTEAFDAWVATEYERVACLARRLVAGQGEINDIVQEVFARAWEKIETFRGDSKINTWLGGITVNVCRSARRRQSAWRLFQRDRGRMALPSAASHPNMENKLADEEVVAKGLQRLRQADRELIVLRWLERRDADEIAAILRLRKSVVEVRLHRAKERLRIVLEKLSE